jgi:hypothetical protein
MKVRAIRTGFFDHIRRRGDDVLGEGRGDVFTIPDKPTRKLSDKDAKDPAFDAVKTSVKVKVDGKDVTEVHAPAAFGKWMAPVGAREAERVTTGPQALATVQGALKAEKSGQAATGDSEVI